MTKAPNPFRQLDLWPEVTRRFCQVNLGGPHLSSGAEFLAAVVVAFTQDPLRRFGGSIGWSGDAGLVFARV